jgi:SnoaL-like domain
MSNLDKHRTVHEAYNRRDWTTLAQNFAFDAEYTEHPTGVVLKGPQEVVDHLRTWWVTSFSDGSITDAEYIDAGDHVVAQFTGTGINDGALGPMPRTIRRIFVPFCEIMRFNADGQIIIGHLYYDLATILVQLDHMQAPPVALNRTGDLLSGPPGPRR